MIVGLFSHRPFIKIFFCRFAISISRFRITTHFPGNFPEISPKIFGNFSENSYTHHLPPSPTPHITHPHPIPEPVNPLRTLNSIFSIAHRRSKGTFISHRTHIINIPVPTSTYLLKFTLMLRIYFINFGYVVVCSK